MRARRTMGPLHSGIARLSGAGERLRVEECSVRLPSSLTISNVLSDLRSSSCTCTGMATDIQVLAQFSGKDTFGSPWPGGARNASPDPGPLAASVNRVPAARGSASGEVISFLSARARAASVLVLLSAGPTRKTINLSDFSTLLLRQVLVRLPFRMSGERRAALRKRGNFISAEMSAATCGSVAAGEERRFGAPGLLTRTTVSELAADAAAPFCTAPVPAEEGARKTGTSLQRARRRLLPANRAVVPASYGRSLGDSCNFLMRVHPLSVLPVLLRESQAGDEVRRWPDAVPALRVGIAAGAIPLRFQLLSAEVIR